MIYFKIVDNGYIVSCGTYNGEYAAGAADIIDETEYNTIVNAYINKPEASETVDYKLKTDLMWEEYEVEPEPEPEPDDSDKAEAYDILMGTVTWQSQK